jgi:type IV pilus assembly protein PilO
VLPEEKDGADLLRQMQATAVQSNLVIKSFKPAPVSTKQLHAEWPITLELDGTYHNLAVFFDRLGKFARIVNISDLNVKAKDNKGDPRATISASCVATTFVLLDKPAPKKDAAGKPAAKATDPKKVA